MATHHDQLIADWRQELAAAESAVIDSPRAAWLARVRVRLYRFLLRCYCGEVWNVGEGAEVEQPAAGADSELVVFSPSEYEGKPAKSEAKIRAVLKAVAGAQGVPHAPGPLAAGLDGESWVIVAAASSKLKVGRCFQLLKAAGITARTAYRGDDHMVEVPANQRHAAFEIVERNRARVHAPPNTPRTQRIPLWARLASITIVSMWVTGVLAWLVLVAVHILSSPGVPEPTIDPIAADEFYRIWLSLFIAGFLLLALGLLRRNRPIVAVKPRESR